MFDGCSCISDNFGELHGLFGDKPEEASGLSGMKLRVGQENGSAAI